MALAPSPSLISLDSVDSTNSYLHSIVDAPHGTVVATREQTAGRGQRGNSWEAAPGQNITMSMMLRPQWIAPRRQFAISEAVSLAIVECLDELVEDVAIKWPNDIYVSARKICGILIEHTLAGSAIEHTIAGIGLNVNQTVFTSDAPNPVSLAQITGQTHPLDTLTLDIATRILRLLETTRTDRGREALHSRYLERLWRRNDMSPYLDCATGRRFHATIADVDPDGTLRLSTADGRQHSYAFKEVAFVL